MPRNLFTSGGSTNNTLSQLRAYLHERLQAALSESGVPGIGVALSVDGHQLLESVGFIDIESCAPLTHRARFQLGCITKLMTCVVAATLIEEGKLDVEAPIGVYLKEFKDSSKGNALCIWQIMSHTSGFQSPNMDDLEVAYYYTWNKFVHYFNSAPQLFSPGSVFSYVHADHVILGEIIERITGSSITESYRERIFQPLRIVAGSIRGDLPFADECVVDHRYDQTARAHAKLRPMPFCSFWRASLSDVTMPLADQLSLVEAIAGFNRKTGDLGPSRFAMSFVQKQVIKLPTLLGTQTSEQFPLSFGVGCAAYRGRLLGHNGSARGQTCGVRFDTNTRMAVAVGVNAWHPYLRDALLNEFTSVMRGYSVSSDSPRTIDFEFEDLQGIYDGPCGTECLVTVEDFHLKCLIENRATQKSSRICLSKDKRCGISLGADSRYSRIGFFRNPDNGEAALMWGLSAFRKRCN